MWLVGVAVLGCASALVRPVPQAPARAAARRALPLHFDQPQRGSRLWTPTMRGGDSTGGAAVPDENWESAGIGPPPDLPSLLLANRIVYLGMPLVPAVTELIVAQLLYLNYESRDRPVTLYINSPGTIDNQGRSVGFETEAFAIADCMRYIKPPVRTVCVGQAYGAAALLLAMGQKGQRYCLPNASIMLHQPKSQARGQASDIAIKAREVMANRKVQCELMARACGKSVDEVLKDASRTKYLQPAEAVDYGLIDAVLVTPGKGKKANANEPSFMQELARN